MLTYSMWFVVLFAYFHANTFSENAKKYSYALKVLTEKRNIGVARGAKDAMASKNFKKI